MPGAAEGSIQWSWYVVIGLRSRRSRVGGGCIVNTGGRQGHHAGGCHVLTQVEGDSGGCVNDGSCHHPGCGDPSSTEVVMVAMLVVVALTREVARR